MEEKKLYTKAFLLKTSMYTRLASSAECDKYVKLFCNASLC